MRHLFSGVALATLLLAALPATAQTSDVGQPSARPMDKDQDATSTKPMHDKLRHGVRHRTAPDDFMADALNRQELERINQEQTAAGPNPVPAPPRR